MPSPTEWISSIGSGLGSIFSLFGQGKQIDAENERFQQQLAWQKEQYERDLQNSWDMFNATNEWNSEQAQSARLKAAGINPQLDGVNASTGSAVSMPQGSQYGEAYKRPVPNYAALADGVFNGLSMFASLSSMFEDIRSKKLDNEKKEMGQFDDVIRNIISAEDLDKFSEYIKGKSGDDVLKEIEAGLKSGSKTDLTSGTGEITVPALASGSYVSSLAQKLNRLNPYSGNKRKSARFLKYATSSLLSNYQQRRLGEDKLGVKQQGAETRKIDELLDDFLDVTLKQYQFESQQYITGEQRKKYEQQVQQLKSKLSQAATDMISGTTKSGKPDIIERAGGYLVLILLTLMENSSISAGGFGKSRGAMYNIGF